MPKKGLERQSFGNSFRLKEMATSTECNRVANSCNRVNQFNRVDCLNGISSVVGTRRTASYSLMDTKSEPNNEKG